MVKAARSREQSDDAVATAAVSPVNLATAAERKDAAPAVPVMTGTHFHALDEKGRIIIPSKLRPALTGQFWLMLDENDNIGIYNYQTGLDVFAHCEQMMAQYPDDEEIATAVERITGPAELVGVEGNWRVQLPELLRMYAQLDKEVVTVGVLNHAVVWSRENWEVEQQRRLQSTPVRRAQAGLLRAAASGIGKKAHGQEKQDETENLAHTEAAGAQEYSGGGRVRGAAGNMDARGRAVKPAASAGDGKRGSRVLTLSQLGR